MPDEDLHLADHARSQAHEGAAPSAPGAKHCPASHLNRWPDEAYSSAAVERNE